MSDHARLWSRRIRGGLTMGEHAVLRELAEYHVQETNLCFPRLDTICTNFEISRAYLKRVLSRLENWQLLFREEAFRKDKSNTSNRIRLSLDRHFPHPLPSGRRTRDKNPNQKHKGPTGELLPGPRPYDERDDAALLGAQKGIRVLRAVQSLLSNDLTLVMGLKEAFVEIRMHKNRRLDDLIWIAIESPSHEKNFLKALPEVEAELKKGFGTTPAAAHPFEIEVLPLFYRARGRSTDKDQPQLDL